MAKLFLALSERLKIIEIDNSPLEVVVGTRIFLRIDDVEFHGFYDWLRQVDGRIIGVRYFVYADYSFIADAIRQLDYVSIGLKDTLGTMLTIFFGEERLFECDLSADQNFSGDYFFRSLDGRYGISFEGS